MINQTNTSKRIVEDLNNEKEIGVNVKFSPILNDCTMTTSIFTKVYLVPFEI
mgnify:CR=1 FL=1